MRFMPGPASRRSAGHERPLASSYRSTLFSFGEGPTVRIRFPPAESPSLNGNWPGEVEKPAFRANVRAMPGDGVGRDRYGRATSHHWRRMSLLGQISVPRGRRWIEADRGVLPLSAAEYWRT